MKVGFCSLGCKVNLYESEYMMSLFKERGYTIGDFDEDCDIYVINTCTVTNNADSKSRKMINHIKNNHPNSIIVVCGCFVESNKFSDTESIDIVIGNYNKSKVVDLVSSYIKEKKQLIEQYDMKKVPFEDMMINHFEDKTRAFVKIQDGCCNFCSYCIIPYVRGPIRSKKFNKVLEEVKSLVSNDYKEIVLTGIHTGSYGKDLETNFSTLLEELLKIENLKRLRISSIEITELDDKFLELLKNDKLCNHLHIPLQSGSDKILKLMNRKYDKKQFLEMINKIRSIRPSISITTDAIVGFPQETEEDFEEYIDFVKQVKFSKLHVFPYSKRNGTKAAEMDGQIDPKVKKERAKKLIELSKKLEKEYAYKFIGEELDVLVENHDSSYAYGHTSNYLKIRLDKECKHNEIVKVKITKDNICL
ncbi:MAG: tRNA (N(6)-L-threonylcarbamoyladenosine(37)-C(2))-methylthiotransferase MtaB [bacterium]|nr:tRNA (N(6)-L-threonylcarbamoyladenosine(37)-C(2))-methylthiotransferase MtaB [bacterium]